MSTGREFDAVVRAAGRELRKSAIEVLQVNVGKLCNLTCIHCHVEAGPFRREIMEEATARAVVRFLGGSVIPKLDLTGGAPEMNPHFEYLVREGVRLGRHVMDRCNLTVFYEKDRDHLPEFLARHNVEIIASLPCYLQENVDRQRGKGTFSDSIRALRWLNRLGYGDESTGLLLNLVYNPVGAHLPPSQRELERDYRERLLEDWGIRFNHLYTITNMPITRYAKYLRTTGEFDAYMELLVKSFNAETVQGLMCRNTLSVGWDGALYDCDFNQMLDMCLGNGRPLTIFDAGPGDFEHGEILTGPHCFGCTAGNGSTCGGAVIQ